MSALIGYLALRYPPVGSLVAILSFDAGFHNLNPSWLITMSYLAYYPSITRNFVIAINFGKFFIYRHSPASV